VTLTIELDPQTEANLAAEAKRAGIAEPEFALKVLRQHLAAKPADTKTHEENEVLQGVLAKRRAEGAAMTPEELADEDRFWEGFQAAINDARREQGMRQL
jgi:hypothetical protein